MKELTKRYTKGELAVIWRPHLCIHSTICFKGLPQVFNPGQRPWITPENAGNEEIIAQIKKCPSGALSYLISTEDDQTNG
jgi:uncharacterized Fe-S cluster protein YjdI